MIWLRLTAVDGKQIYFDMNTISHFQRHDSERTRLYSVVPKGDGLRSMFVRETPDDIVRMLAKAQAKVIES